MGKERKSLVKMTGTDTSSDGMGAMGVRME